MNLLNASTLTCLEEGLEETLAPHRLGVFPHLGRSLKTTHYLESLNSLVAQRVAKVDRWRSSNQTQRWLAAARRDIEPRLRRIRGYRAIPLLRGALERECWPEAELTVAGRAAEGHAGVRFGSSTRNGIDPSSAVRCLPWNVTPAAAEQS
jgi:hypothetical protein